MRNGNRNSGAASVAVLSQFESWEANLVLNLRLWCEGPNGKAQVWNEYACAFAAPAATQEMQAFEALIAILADHALRPLVRHAVHCSCVGSDECVFLNLVRTAADGQLNDAALIATLLAGPAQAETIAVLAGQVGETARRIRASRSYQPTVDTSNVVRLH